MDDDVKFTREDVIVQDAPDECCDECTVSPAPKLVVLDLRSAGMETAVGRYCAPCAEEVARRIRDGLPR